ncbi:MAG: hypothetical protein WA140_03955 [Geobacteraceae bacterium]
MTTVVFFHPEAYAEVVAAAAYYARTSDKPDGMKPSVPTFRWGK